MFQTCKAYLYPADELSASYFSDGNDSAGDQSSGDSSKDTLSAGDISGGDDPASFLPEELDLDDQFVDTKNTVMSGIDSDDDISVELKEDKPASTPIRGKLYYVVAPTHSLMTHAAFNTKQFLADSASKH